MSTGDLLLLGFGTAAIGMGTVFLTLILLSGVIALQSKLLQRKEKATAVDKPGSHSEEVAERQSADTPQAYGSEDEEILAVIMASVARAAGIPLEKLIFKTVKTI